MSSYVVDSNFVPPIVFKTSNIEKVPISIISHSNDNNFIAYNLNDKLNVVDLKNNKLVELESSSHHTNTIRSIEFAKNSKILVTTSNDKSIKVWDCQSNFKNIKTINVNKKIICCTLNKDDTEILVSDKCGDVFTYSLVSENSIPVVSGDKSVKHDEKESDKNLIFGHYSSIIDIKFSPCFEYLLSGDRDEKVRVSKFPNCFDIQSFCLGHSKYITEIFFIPNKPETMVTGSGDGTLKVWNWKDGKCLQTVDFNGTFENAITIPQAYNVNGNQLYFSIENSSNLYAIPMNLESSQLQQDKLITIPLASSPISIDLLGNGDNSIVLASLVPVTKDIDVIVAIDTTLNSVATNNKISTLINSLDSTTTLKPTELKVILEAVEKKQFRKHCSYSKQYQERSANNNNNNNKKGDGDDEELSLDEQDMDDGEQQQESKKDKRPLKLRKMTIEGDKEIQKELKEKEDNKKQE